MTSTGRHLLVFRHPTAGIQVPAGTIEPGEAPEDTVLRELLEETRLADATLERRLILLHEQLWPKHGILNRDLSPRTHSGPHSSEQTTLLNRGHIVRIKTVDEDVALIAIDEHTEANGQLHIHTSAQGWIPISDPADQYMPHWIADAPTIGNNGVIYLGSDNGTNYAVNRDGTLA